MDTTILKKYTAGSKGFLNHAEDLHSAVMKSIVMRLNDEIKDPNFMKVQYIKISYTYDPDSTQHMVADMGVLYKNSITTNVTT